jgi:hypothetical protein
MKCEPAQDYMAELGSQVVMEYDTDIRRRYYPEDRINNRQYDMYREGRTLLLSILSQCTSLLAPVTVRSPYSSTKLSEEKVRYHSLPSLHLYIAVNSCTGSTSLISLINPEDRINNRQYDMYREGVPRDPV